MCIICASKSGVRQPTERELFTMFQNNPHGAGYMTARHGMVTISKGYMDFDEFLNAVRKEHFTAQDSVVYHFRISTQAGVNPEMTHPFPLSNRLPNMKALDVECPCGVAHNGIIRLTSDPTQHEYSDTALFITHYMVRMVHGLDDLKDAQLLNRIERLAGSKLAIMDGSGYIATIGNFINERGLLFSSDSYRELRWRYRA